MIQRGLENWGKQTSGPKQISWRKCEPNYTLNSAVKGRWMWYEKRKSSLCERAKVFLSYSISWYVWTGQDTFCKETRSHEWSYKGTLKTIELGKTKVDFGQGHEEKQRRRKCCFLARAAGEWQQRNVRNVFTERWMMGFQIVAHLIRKPGTDRKGNMKSKPWAEKRSIERKIVEEDGSILLSQKNCKLKLSCR